jgi:Domain of unknown function (DUF5916)
MTPRINLSPRAKGGLVLAVGLLPALAGLLRAQSPGSPARSPDAAPPVAAAAPADGPITIDGRLDEAAWQRAQPITDFRQYEPDEGSPASQPTEVRILYGPHALYIGARMREPGGVVAPLARRDQLLDANGNNGSFNSLTTDKLIIDLDPYHNQLDDAWFEVNPAGVTGDQFDGDPSWDPVWQAATRVDSLGWTVEMRIPFSQLRFGHDSVQTWGLQIWRYLDRRNEHDMWSFRRQKESGGPAFFGTLTGLHIPPQPREVELLPYVVTGGTLQPTTAGDPYQDGRTGRASAGADLKALLTSSLTLDATLNPDFGQVEVDPATLNLSAFETYYPEKRPFFIAGASNFSFGGLRCMFCNISTPDPFYSRRVGRPPQLAGWVSDHSAYAQQPDNSTILGAAKITGRTPSGYTVGLLDAVTNRETARYVPAAGAAERTQIVEPYTNYFVGRVEKQFGGGASTLGALLTSTARAMPDTIVSDALHSHAEEAGVDWRHTWHQHEYSWMGNVLFSDVGGSPAAIAATQRSSAHYFQRPDRQLNSDGLFGARYDTTATSLKGYGMFTRVGKDNGTLLWEAMTDVLSPGFEVNDLGYIQGTDNIWLNGNVGAQATTPTRWYRNLAGTIGGYTQYDYEGDRTGAGLQAFYSMTFPNYWRVRLIGSHDVPSLDPGRTRGGPVVERAGSDWGSIELSTDPRAPAVFDFAVQATRGVAAPTHGLTLSPGLALKPAANVFLQLSPTYRSDEDDAQYVTAVGDPTATAFYGSRYVFAFVRTKTVSLDTRLNWTFTPNLTLQLYAQPFVARGQYTSFREFAAPRSIDKLVYGKDVGTIAYDPTAATYTVDPDGAGSAAPFSFANPDFTDTSLRGTAVLRWQYRPGSTLYFVWTQERSGTDPSGSVGFPSAVSAMFRDHPTNVFQINATYWIGR